MLLKYLLLRVLQYLLVVILVFYTGVEDSPLMTWGEIEGTPFRLDGTDTPLITPRTPGPSFKIADIPKRDRIAHRLSEDASKAHRAKKDEAMKRVQAKFSM